MLKNALIFTSGAAIGAFVTWRILDKKYADREIENRQIMQEVYRKKTESAEAAAKAKAKPDLTVYKNLVKTSDYSYTHREDIPSEEEQEDDVESEELEEEPTDEDMQVDTVEEFDPEDSPAAEFTPDDFSFIDSSDYSSIDGYDKVNLTYYKDGLLADAYDEVVSIEDTIGIEALKMLQKNPFDDLFVRNEKTQTDYMIDYDNRVYSDVTGIFINSYHE
jgi:hypothetical protein